MRKEEGNENKTVFEINEKVTIVVKTEQVTSLAEFLGTSKMLERISKVITNIDASVTEIKIPTLNTRNRTTNYYHWTTQKEELIKDMMLKQNKSWKETAQAVERPVSNLRSKWHNMYRAGTITLEEKNSRLIRRK